MAGQIEYLLILTEFQ